MPKSTLEFNLNDMEDQRALTRSIKADSAYRSLWDTANEVFRPARKHGYQDEKIQLLVESIGVDAETLIGLLEDKFYEILKDNDINLDEY